MQSRRSWRIRILALAWPAALMITLAVNPIAQAGTTGEFETKLRLGGPVPVKGDETRSASTSAIAKGNGAEPAAGSQQTARPQSDLSRASEEAWVWQCDPAASEAMRNPNAVCDDFVALR